MIMSLDNLVGVSLEKIEPDASVINRLLKAAERNITDSHVIQVSGENRFDAAYKAIMQLSMRHCRRMVLERLRVSLGII